ncbi:VOC family protein [Solirhodobacter olei]|uniref:VOC family protein n=1 Tax=Solirhodobacter olei TaxID=2493082 RepID=UPI000FD728FF|nr:VOC family protein [Solirhodobacter olei]
MELDHIAVTAEGLEAGRARVEEVLGVALQPGGRHAAMGTHNALLALDDVYLEVIAVDPEAEGPGRPRWFDMDSFSGAPRLTNWIVRTGELEAEVARGPEGVGVPMAFTRGDLSWRMAVPVDGRLPFDGAFPAVIQWNGSAHPAPRLQARGCRLLRLLVAHPEAAGLREALAGRLRDPRVEIVSGAEKALSAEIETPHGVRVLA